MRWPILLVVAACGSRADKPAAKKDAGVELHHTGAPVAPVVVLPRQDAFALLERGQDPASPLRYARAPGAVEQLVETRLRSRHAQADAWSPWTSLDVRDGFGVTTAAPGPLALRPLAPESLAPSADADAYLHGWRALQDRRLTIAVDDRGQLGTAVFNDDPRTAHSAQELDEIVQRLLGTLVPVPVEPVGIGARWRVVTILRQRPAVVKQTATYTLAARTAKRWTIAVDMQRIGEQQLLDDPGLPDGTTAELVALVRHYAGTVEIDPARLLPTGGSLAIDSRMHLRVGHLPGPIYEEQVFEDEGTLGFTAK